jgi:hypothetical protein
VLFSGGGDGSLTILDEPPVVRDALSGMAMFRLSMSEMISKLRALPSVSAADLSEAQILIKQAQVSINDMNDIARASTRLLRKSGRLDEISNAIRRAQEAKLALEDLIKEKSSRKGTPSSSTGGRRSLGSALQWPSARLWM